jgi:hypothetical protein
MGSLTLRTPEDVPGNSSDTAISSSAASKWQQLTSRIAKYPRNKLIGVLVAIGLVVALAIYLALNAENLFNPRIAHIKSPLNGTWTNDSNFILLLDFGKGTYRGVANGDPFDHAVNVVSATENFAELRVRRRDGSAFTAYAELSGDGRIKLKKADSQVTLALRNVGHEAGPKEVPRTESQTNWSAVRSWTGTGSRTTESFRISSDEWRISWEAEGDRAYGVLLISIYRVGGDLVDLIYAEGASSNSSYVHNSPGEYYLQIAGANIRWKVTAFDRR